MLTYTWLKEQVEKGHSWEADSCSADQEISVRNKNLADLYPEPTDILSVCDLLGKITLPSALHNHIPFTYHRPQT
jgi:hypothetical protein